MSFKRGDTGDYIIKWQTFLAGAGYFQGEYAPVFGPQTEKATVRFQQANGLTPDGIVGPNTLARAKALGFSGFSADVVQEKNEAGWMDPNWPPPVDADHDGKPDVFYQNEAWREATFGKFPYKAAPIPDNRERIIILDDWVSKNIVWVELPGLSGVSGAPAGRKVQFHKKAAPQLAGLFAAWKDAGIISYLKTWGGSFNPRFIRGSTKTLSNHSIGTAFDINVPWNGLGQQPALVGQTGTVRPLVTIAEEFGFYWGGRYKNRKDGMHFEVMRIV